MRTLISVTAFPAFISPVLIGERWALWIAAYGLVAMVALLARHTIRG